MDSSLTRQSGIVMVTIWFFDGFPVEFYLEIPHNSD